jgi:hypothetical protein
MSKMDIVKTVKENKVKVLLGLLLVDKLFNEGKVRKGIINKIKSIVS